jgi:hypothetical protein
MHHAERVWDQNITVFVPQFLLFKLGSNHLRCCQICNTRPLICDVINGTDI